MQSTHVIINKIIMNFHYNKMKTFYFILKLKTVQLLTTIFDGFLQSRHFVVLDRLATALAKECHTFSCRQNHVSLRPRNEGWTHLLPGKFVLSPGNYLNNLASVT
jgi:hypothetical protein